MVCPVMHLRSSYLVLDSVLWLRESLAVYHKRGNNSAMEGRLYKVIDTQLQNSSMNMLI